MNIQKADSDVNKNPVNLIAILIALGLTILMLALQIGSDRYPIPKAMDAPEDEFSGYRAQAILQNLLAENVPHAVGTPENKIVKQRILKYVEKYGMQIEEQKAFACSPNIPGNCAFVENIIAKIPGIESGPAVLLMAHYDSQSATPGAGDAGSGVAALLEAARIISAEAPFKNPIIFLFTDGEESMMLGARAFFGKHPLSKKIGVIINIEGGGTEGPSILFSTGQNNSWFIDAYVNSAEYLEGNSITNLIWNLMANDDDLSIAKENGLTGLDFVIGRERNHYHTSLDNVSNLSLTTLQHHGENVLPLIRVLARMDLVDQPKEQKVYFSLFKKIWISWNTRTSMFIALFSLLLLAGSAISLIRKGQTTSRKIFTGFLTALSILPVVILLNAAIYFILYFINGSIISWPAHLWPFRLTILTTSFVGGLLVLRLIGKRQDFWSSFIGVWALWLLFGIITSLSLPEASVIFLSPILVVSAVVLFLSLPLSKNLKYKKEIIASVGVAIATPFTLGMAYTLELVLGYELIGLVFPILALYVVTLAPLFQYGLAKGNFFKPLMIGSAVVLMASVLFAVTLPHFNENRKQHLNIYHIQDNDNRTAQLMVTSPNPMPETMQKMMDFNPDEIPAVEPFGFLRFGIPGLGVVGKEPIAEAGFTEEPAPNLVATSMTTDGDSRKLSLRFSSNRKVNYGMILIPESANLRLISIEGQSQSLEISDLSREIFGDYHLIHVAGVPDTSFDLDVELGAMEPAEFLVIDYTSKLPEQARELIKARQSSFATPVHKGDQSIVFTRILI